MAPVRRPRAVLVFIGLALASAGCSSTMDRLPATGATASKEELVAILGPPVPPESAVGMSPDACVDPVVFKDEYDARLARWLDDRLGASDTYFILCFDADGRRTSGLGIRMKDY